MLISYASACTSCAPLGLTSHPAVCAGEVSSLPASRSPRSVLPLRPRPNGMRLPWALQLLLLLLLLLPLLVLLLLLLQLLVLLLLLLQLLLWLLVQLLL